MKLITRGLSVLIMVNFLVCLFPFNTSAAAVKKVTVDYNKQTMTIAVTKIKNAYMLPLNDIITAWGGTSKLDSSKKFITATVEKLTLKVTNGSKVIKIKSDDFTMEAPAVLQSTTMYITIDVFSKAFGMKTVLNASKTSVVIDFSKSENAEVVNVSIPLLKPKFTINFTFVGFYNAGSNVPDPRGNPAIQYAFSFNKSTAKNICYYTKVTYNGLGTTVDAPLTAKYYKKDGSLFYELKSNLQLKKGSSSFYFRFGLGWDTAGNWPVDNYALEIYLWDKLVDKEQFNIFSLKPDGSKDSAPADVDQMNGSIWTQKDGNGYKGIYAFLLKDGYIFIDFKGDANSIYNNEGGLRASKAGNKYKLTSDKLIVYVSNGKASEYDRKENSIIIGTGVLRKDVTKGINGEPDLESVLSLDGEYVLTSK